MNILINDKKNKLVKVLFIMIIFLSFINRIRAVSLSDPAYDKEHTSDLYKYCNNDSECIPICIYDIHKYEEGLFEDKSYIGYNYKNVEWDITTIENLSIQEGSAIYRFKDSKVPTKDINWEDYGSWKNIYERTLLEDRFICPNYFYLDTNNDREICFANEFEKCEKLDNFNVGTDYGDHYSLKYSFRDEATSVLKDAIDKLKIYATTDTDDAKKIYNIIQNNILSSTNYTSEELDKIADLSRKKSISFLSNFDNEIKYDSATTGKENVTNNCKYIKEQFKDTKQQEKYKNKLLLAENIKRYNNEIVIKQISESARSIGVRENRVYEDYDILTSLISKPDRKNRPVQRVTGYNSLINLFTDNLTASITTLINDCNSSANTDINFNEEQFKDSIQEIYITNFYPDPTIELDTEFDCNSIFTPEIADLIRKAYFAIEIIAIIILIGLSSLDYAKVILSGEQDEMKKTNQKLLKRLIIVVVIFLLPALINLILRVVHIEGFDSEHPLCVQIKNK